MQCDRAKRTPTDLARCNRRVREAVRHQPFAIVQRLAKSGVYFQLFQSQNKCARVRMMKRREFLIGSAIAAGSGRVWGQHPDQSKLDRIAIMSLCFNPSSRAPHIQTIPKEPSISWTSQT